MQVQELNTLVHEKPTAEDMEARAAVIKLMEANGHKLISTGEGKYADAWLAWNAPGEQRLADSDAHQSRSINPFVRRLREQYTLCKSCCVDGEPNAHTVWLKVGVQSFCVTPLPCETKDEAEWMRDMLAKALAAVVDGSANNEQKEPKK